MDLDAAASDEEDRRRDHEEEHEDNHRRQHAGAGAGAAPRSASARARGGVREPFRGRHLRKGVGPDPGPIRLECRRGEGLAGGRVRARLWGVSGVAWGKGKIGRAHV